MRTFKKYILLIAVIFMISTASGLPEMLDGFNLKYNTSKTRLDSCETCHIPDNQFKVKSCENCHLSYKSEKKKYLNPYGMDLKNNNKVSEDLAFRKVESLDSDNDGTPNKDEIRGKSFPGDNTDKPRKNVALIVINKTISLIEFIK